MSGIEPRKAGEARMDEAAVRKALLEQARRLGVEVEGKTLHALAEHFALVRKWNRAAGLTAVKGAGEAAELYAEAFQILDQLEWERKGLLVDLGSGGGFPGMTLAILRPGWSVRLVERSARKAAFLQEAARRLGLAGVEVLELNLRNAADFPAGRPFDRLTSKAVGQFALTMDLLQLRGGPGARAILLTGEQGGREVDGEISRRAPGLCLLERRPLADRRSSFAVIVEKG